MAEKRCPDCGQTLPMDAFYNDTRHASGKSTYCKQCHNARVDRSRAKRAARKQQPKASTKNGQPKRKPGSWNMSSKGRNCRPKPKRRKSRQARIAGSIVAAKAELTLRRRELIAAQVRLAETKVHLERLEEIRERLREEAAA